MTGIRWTTKQIQILNTIKQGNADGTDRSVYDIMEALPYTVARDAVLHSIKILVDNGYVERRDRVRRGSKSVRVFKVTTKAAEII